MTGLIVQKGLQVKETTSGGEGGAVESVNGQTGAVTLTKSDLGLNKVDNTHDNEKPISSATQSALDGKTDLTAFEELENYIKIDEEELSTQARTIVSAINEHEGDLIGLQAEQNHIFVDTNEQVYLHFMTDLGQYLFQDNVWHLDSEVSYNVPEPKSLYVKLDFSRVVPTSDTVNSADHVFGVYRTDYSRILAIYCTQGSTDEKIKLTMLQGGHTIEAEILPSDNVILESGTGYHKLFVNGVIVGYPITQDIKADKIILGNADNSTAFLEGSSISYKAYVMELTPEQEKAFIAEPTDVVEDIVVIDALGNVKKYFLPTTDVSDLVTTDQLSTGLSTKAPVRPMVAIHTDETIDLLENTDYMSLIPIDNLTIHNYSTSRYETTVLFSSGEIATTLTLPPNIKWLNGSAITLEANRTYLITIRNGLWRWEEFY